MKALYYDQFKGPITITTLPDPEPPTAGVVIEVRASGICRSDWHGWQGHDPDITLPHVPGHELAGTVVEVGKEVKQWKSGDRVTLPFVCGCGRCFQCASGNHQVCDFQFQPGFTHWGSFAQYVAIDYADTNLVRLPDSLDFVTAAGLGCRFVTSFRALIDQGRLTPGQWVAVHGCGGVGLSAIMIAKAWGAKIIAVDINREALDWALSLGATAVLDAQEIEDIPAAVRSISSGGVHISIDALGSQETCFNSISNLRKRGKHIQVGLMVGEDYHPRIPMEKVIADELQLIGSHGMQAHQYDRLFDLIEEGSLQPENLIGKRISLGEAVKEITTMDQPRSPGITVIDHFYRS